MIKCEDRQKREAGKEWERFWRGRRESVRMNERKREEREESMRNDG